MQTLRPTAEGIVRILRDAFGQAVEPTFGTELLGIVEVTRIAVRHPLTHEDGRPLRHPVSTEFHILGRFPANQINRRQKPHRFSQNRISVSQLRQIADAWVASLQMFVPFLQEFILHLWDGGPTDARSNSM